MRVDSVQREVDSLLEWCPMDIDFDADDISGADLAEGVANRTAWADAILVFDCAMRGDAGSARRIMRDATSVRATTDAVADLLALLLPSLSSRSVHNALMTAWAHPPLWRRDGRTA